MHSAVIFARTLLVPIPRREFLARMYTWLQRGSQGQFATGLATTYYNPTPNSPINNTPIATMIRLLRSLLTTRRNRICLLERLPNEIILQIAAHLAPKLCDLNALLRTDRFLHHLLTLELSTAALCAAPDSNGRTTLRNVAARSTSSLLAKLLSLAQGAGVDAAEPVGGTTALDAAIMLERADVVEVLLRHGASVEVGDRQGWTPLHFAALSGNCGIAGQLLDCASDRVCSGQGCTSGATPLHFAAAKGDNDMVELLVHRGASVAAVDRYGRKAVDHAVLGGWPKTVKLIGGSSSGGGGEGLLGFGRVTAIQRPISVAGSSGEGGRVG